MDSVELEIKRKYSNIPGNEAIFPQENFYTFVTSDQVQLHTYRYPCSSPSGLVIIFHGIHAYCNNYALVAKSLSEVGCEVAAFDWRGHGKSDGTRGLLPQFDVLLDDCCKFVLEISAQYSNLPLFLAGGSLGACMCIHVQRRITNVKGMILFSPALKANIKCFPSMPLVKGDPKLFCPYQELIDYLEENPYIYSGKIRAMSAATAAEGMSLAAEMIEDITTPFVAIQGSDDKVVDPEMVEVLKIRARLEENDKQVWMYEGLSHALIYEKEIYEILERVQRWITERINV
jgi:acylglycerol lipase